MRQVSVRMMENFREYGMLEDMDTNKYIIGGIILVFLVITGIWFMKPSSVVAPGAQPSTAFITSTSTYATSTLGISAIYPKSYSVNDSYAYDQFGPKKLIHGVKFLIPETVATGTNLTAFDTGVAVEALPHAIRCSADIYLPGDVRAQLEIINGVTYSVASTTGAGAGNLYEETIYALPDSKPCTALRYFIHSTNIANYPEGAVREFDRAALLKDFDSIRDSIQLTR